MRFKSSPPHFFLSPLKITLLLHYKRYTGLLLKKKKPKNSKRKYIKLKTSVSQPQPTHFPEIRFPILICTVPDTPSLWAKTQVCVGTHTSTQFVSKKQDCMTFVFSLSNRNIFPCQDLENHLIPYNDSALSKVWMYIIYLISCLLLKI